METIEHIKRNDNPSNVIGAIESVRQRISVMGANDTENSDLNSILQRWQNKEISDTEAISLAEGVEKNKQDYH